MRENLIIMPLTVIDGILQKIMLKFFFLFNLIIQNKNFYAGVPRPPVPLLYSYHQQVTLANNKRLTEVQNTTFYGKNSRSASKKSRLAVESTQDGIHFLVNCNIKPMFFRGEKYLLWPISSLELRKIFSP